MKDYERLTKWSELGTLHVFDINGKEIPLCDVSPIDTDNLAGRLADLEDKIENGELIERTSEEYSAVRKQAVEECLRILRNIRLQLPRHYGVFWEGWSGAFNAAIRAISQKYAVSVEEECGE